MTRRERRPAQRVAGGVEPDLKRRNTAMGCSGCWRAPRVWHGRAVPPLRAAATPRQKHALRDPRQHFPRRVCGGARPCSRRRPSDDLLQALLSTLLMRTAFTSLPLARCLPRRAAAAGRFRYARVRWSSFERDPSVCVVPVHLSDDQASDVTSCPPEPFSFS